MTTVPDMVLNRERGFTLFEILISMALLSLVAVALFSLHSGMLRSAGTGSFHHIIPLLADQALAAVETKGLSESEAELSGTFPEPYQDFSWKAHIETPLTHSDISLEEKQAIRLKKIRIEIYGQGSQFSLVSWRYGLDPNE